MLSLSFRDLEQLLMLLHKVPETRRMTLRSRVQHLQRGHVPARSRVGRGVRAIYGVDETFQMVLAMELASLNWSAQAIAEVVVDRWPLLRQLVDLGIAAFLADEVDAPARYALIRPDALASLRGDAPRTVVELVSGDALAARAVRAVGGDDGHLFLDVVSLVRRSLRQLRQQGRIEGMGT